MQPTNREYFRLSVLRTAFRSCLRLICKDVWYLRLQSRTKNSYASLMRLSRTAFSMLCVPVGLPQMKAFDFRRSFCSTRQ